MCVITLLTLSSLAQSSKEGFFHSLSDPMRISLIDMARHYQLAQSKLDILRLKTQRGETKRKQDTKFQLSNDKATNNNVEVVLL